MYTFQNALPIWRNEPEKQYNQFVGFHTQLNLKETTQLHIAISARSYYRLYLNGEMIASGPARTAVHHCRIDELTANAQGDCHIAIEVAAYSKPEMYCNDCTMETGMLIAEISDAAGHVLTATCQEGWTCQALTYRRGLVETMSHCRGIVEYYDLTPESFTWRQKALSEKPVILDEKITFLERRAPYPTYAAIPFRTLQTVYDMREIENTAPDFMITLAKTANPQWYDLIPEENLFLDRLRKEKEAPFTGSLTWQKNCGRIQIVPGVAPAALLWDMAESEVGFLKFSVTVESPCIMDVLNSDVLDESGHLSSNTYATRFNLQPGSYCLTTFEPKLTRYVKLILRTGGRVQMSAPVLLDDSYPDDRSTYFQCSDGDLNRIYEAARRTLRLNTLDIFMDCPERERGGWLCDSYFTSKGAWQLLGDLSVEKDFIENFLLTDPDSTWHGFFPEVYPGTRGTSGDVGIRNWTFWLMLELCDYDQRSGDHDFILQYKDRIEYFVRELLSLRGPSGLLENIGPIFVDWSLSNQPASMEPISVPVNCLAVCMLRQLAALYDHGDWAMAADEMSQIICDLDRSHFSGGSGDSAYMDTESGQLKRGAYQTESGVALEIWSGFHKKQKDYLRSFVETMGSCPKHRSNPNIGKSNLFIGLMVRFDALAKADKIDVLVNEWKDLYLEELKIGPGTLFENISSFSGCHGFNGYIGTLITNKVLGLGEPMQKTKTVVINPHPGDLKWAGGSALCADGIIYLRWSADHEAHVLDMELRLPDGWAAHYESPFELTGWKIRINGKDIIY